MNEEILSLAVKKALRELGVDVKTVSTEFVSETIVQYNNNDGVEALGLALTEGATYTVLWDGQKYTCICKMLPGEDGVPDMLYLGNGSPFGMDDTGEPFMCIQAAIYNGQAVFNIVGIVDENDHTCSIIGEVETINPINSKFMPGICLPVVELGSAVTLTTEEQAQLTAYAKQGVPIIIKLSVDVSYVACVCQFLSYNGEYSYASYGVLTLSYSDGVWTITIED